MDIITSSSIFPARDFTVGFAPPTKRDAGVVLHDVSWEQYQTLLQTFSDRRLRHTYSEGELEIMSPSQGHEEEGEFLDKVLWQMAYELGRDLLCLGSTTLTRGDLAKGIGPDKCYYLANEAKVRRVAAIDFANYPPPDLVLEVDYSSSSLPRVPVYAALGVPELWRVKSNEVSFFTLKAGKFEQVATSVAFPFLTAEKLTELLALRATDQRSDRELVREFVEWVKSQAS